MLTGWIAIAITYFVAAVNSYTVATDCSVEYRAKIHQAATDAFARIDLAAKELEKVAKNEPDMNSNVKELAGFLFEEKDFIEVSRSLSRLYFVSSVGRDAPFELASTATCPFVDSLIYCTADRYPMENGKQSYIDSTWGLDDSEVWDDCFKQDEKLEAWTASSDQQNDPSFGPSIIQFCPWFLKKETVPPEECKGWDKIVKKARDQLDKFRAVPADGVEGIVQTLIHELTHTTAGGKTDDSKHGSKTAWLLRRDSYGWANSVRLHTGRNADSVALFCMHTWQIINCGLKPTKKGEIVKISGASDVAIPGASDVPVPEAS